jgi:hypothetical protein
MVDACTIARNVSTDVLDANGFPTVGTVAAVYSGKCFLDEGQIQNPNPQETAGDYPVVSHFTLKLPVSAGPAVVDDVVVMTACPDHPRDVGVRFRVSSINPGTQKKTQNCQVEVISG